MTDEKQLAIVASGWSISAITLNEWVMIVTIVYGVLQIGLLIPKYIHKWKHRKGSKNDCKKIKRNKK